MKRSLITALLTALAVPSLAQNHPELDWQTLETAHFRILFHQGLEEAAARTAEVAEAAYEPVTELYRYEPADKVRIVLKDYDDYANGAAFFYHDTIEIWTTALDHDFELRGTSDWLSNVVTHEFVHIISLGAARKGPQRTPASYLQYLGYQREKNRPDILVGYPDVIASYPLSMTVLPMWFAEGVAQYQVDAARHDRWDSHRDMVLRTAVLNGELLPFDAMGVFGKRGFGNEYVYDHGYGLVRHIAHTYGDEALARICQQLSSWGSMTIQSAFEDALGTSAEAVYGDWRDSMRAHYDDQVRSLGELRAGEPLEDAQGFSNLHPTLSPDGRKLAYLSNLKGHYAIHALVVRDLESGEEEVVARGVVSSPDWSPDGRRLLFVRKERADRYGSRQADLYEYDTEGPERALSAKAVWVVPATVRGYGPSALRVRRLTRGLRGLYPVYSPDGEWIAFVQNGGRSNNLGIMKADGTDVRVVTNFADGTQLYTPAFSPDGTRMALSVAKRGERDIVVIDLDASMNPLRARALVSTPGTDRDPAWSAAGEELAFASDVTGIFNIYSIAADGGWVKQLTNVVGGAITPNTADSVVAFASFEAQGYRIRLLDRATWLQAPTVALPSTASRGAGAFIDHLVRPVKQESERGRAVIASSGSLARDRVSAQPYGADYLRTLVLPRLMIDEGRFKAGVYLGSSDVLFKQNVLAGAAIAPANGDRDLFAIFEYRKWRPTMFLEFYHQRRASAQGDSSEARTHFITGSRFNLNELRVGGRGKIGRIAELKLDFTYNRYDASIDLDLFEQQRFGFELQSQRPFGYTYLHGFRLGAEYHLRALARRQDREINPRGRDLLLSYDRMFNFFWEDFTNTGQEKYLDLFYNQFSVDWREYLGLPRSMTLGVRIFGGWIDSGKVNDESYPPPKDGSKARDKVGDFFDYHVGGLNYLKGYTFYSIEGRKAFMATGTLRFPILSSVDRRFAHMYIHRLYGALYGGLGKAWDNRFDEADPIYGRQGPLRDVGAQLRLDAVSYYSMPTRIQADLACGIDELAERNPWKFYLTILFGYL